MKKLTLVSIAAAAAIASSVACANEARMFMTVKNQSSSAATVSLKGDAVDVNAINVAANGTVANQEVWSDHNNTMGGHYDDVTVTAGGVSKTIHIHYRTMMDRYLHVILPNGQTCMTGTSSSAYVTTTIQANGTPVLSCPTA